MNSNAREKIFKSWTGTNEVALIKEVATKGEYIDLCIEYWARKRKMAIKDYRLFFHDVVQHYVQRLLTERLVCKAENVLRNVQRDVRCCYYQFACECDDEELREMVLEHLHKDAHGNQTSNDDELLYNWELLQQLKEQTVLLEKCKEHMPERRMDLETMLAMDVSFRKRLEVELYFANGNFNLLPKLHKQSFWNYLVETENSEELVRWCNADGCSATSLRDHQYYNWLPIETAMFEYALKTLNHPTEVLKDCFARLGYFFADERNNVIQVLQRICTTRSFENNRELLQKLPIARYLFDHEQYMLLLRPFVSVRELEELAEMYEGQRKLIELILALRTHNMQDRQGFEKISYATKVYLESVEQKRHDELAHIHIPEEPLVAFYEFLCFEPTIASLSCFLRSSSLQRIPYLVALTDRFESSNNLFHNQTNSSNTQISPHAHKNIPTVYDLLRKFKHIDFKDFNRQSSALNAIVSFSNERLCQRYARKYQLNFLHYLKQQRSAYAVYYFLTSNLQSYAQITRSQLFSACETVTEMALQHADNKELIAHCIAFIEMLDFDTQPLRTMLKLRRLLASTDTNGETDENICVTSVDSFVVQVETHILSKINISVDMASMSSSFPLEEYQALMRLVNSSNQTNQWPTLVLQYYANHDDWWRLLLLFQYFEIPLDAVRHLVSSFETRQLGEHLLRALSYDAPPLLTPSERNNSANTNGVNKRKTARQRKSNADALTQVTTSAETMTSSLSSCNDTSVNANPLSIKTLEKIQQLRFHACLDDNNSMLKATGSHTYPNYDIFALILLSVTAVPEDTEVVGITKFLESIQNVHQEQHSTSWNLLQYAVKYNLPVLAMLASTINESNLDWHWLVWLAVASSQWAELLNVAVQTKEKSYDLAWHIIEIALRHGHVMTVYRSICIFYGPANPFGSLFRFLCLTQNAHEFDEKPVHELSLYLLAWSNDQVRLPLENSNGQWNERDGQNSRREQLLQRTMKLLLLHLQQNFDSIHEQQSFLACICRSGMADLCGGQMDFCLLNEVFAILQNSPQTHTFELNFEQLLQPQMQQQISHECHDEYKRLLGSFIEARAYDCAINLANLLRMPICDIVYAKWIASLNAKILVAESTEQNDDLIDFAAYETEVVEHALPPEVLVNFFLHAASLLDESADSISARRKYILLHHALNAIKKHLLFPNESFDRDQIEYNMIICYLHLNESIAINLNIYHSEYYEQIMLQERCVLYKSFLELKQLAGIEDLNGGSIKIPLTDEMQQRLKELLHRLLDESDIVEALRLQELFDYRPLDLRFIVFCMALAEGVTTIFSMSSEERQLLRDVEKSASAKFNKRTLDTMRSMGSQGNQQSYSSSPMRDDLSDSCSTLEFEEIPSKEKRETLETIQCIASKLKHGVNLGKRIVMAYRAAMYLDKEYLDVMRTKDANILLRSVSEEGCLHRLLVISDILLSTHMTADEIAEFIAHEITTAVIRPRFYIFSAGQKVKSSFKNADLWGYNIDRDFHLFLELTPNTTKLGNCLLKYCDALKTYRKYQDNKPYENSDMFEKLVEIIRIYGLPTASAAATTSIEIVNISAGGGGGNTIINISNPLTGLANVNESSTIGNGGGGGGGGSGSGGNNSNINNHNTNTIHPPQVLSHKKQNLIYVELLIKAHQCFVHECSMEGIANVLYRAKSLNTILTHAKSWSLIVRMLIGIGRYREMFYCFDALIENEQFESLLGQFDEEKTIGLRQAILSYLREYGPPNSRELLKLAALHFLMYKDLAEIWEQDAQMLLAKVIEIGSITVANANNNGSIIGINGGGGGVSNEQIPILRLRYSAELFSLLQQALENYTHATENYLLDNKLLLAQKSASMCEVIAMQIDLINKINGGIHINQNSASNNNNAATTTISSHTSCVCVINIQTRDEFRELVNAELSVPQALILSRGYNYDINWTEALLSQHILLMRKQYLNDYLSLLTITDSIIENIVKGFQRYMQNHHKTMPQMEKNLTHLITLVRSVTLKYKLASLLSMKTFIMSVINDQTVHYLKDTNYGRNENHNMPEI